MRLPGVLVLGDVGVRIGLLIEVAERVVNLAVLRLVGTDVQQEVPHCAVAGRHVPVFDCLGELAGECVGQM